MLVIHQQLNGSHEHSSKLFVLHVFLACAVSFQTTKPGNVESINTVKKFSWVSWTTKISLHENLKHENFITWKFPDLRYLLHYTRYKESGLLPLGLHITVHQYISIPFYLFPLDCQGSWGYSLAHRVSKGWHLVKESCSLNTLECVSCTAHCSVSYHFEGTQASVDLVPHS